jgi:hypothetical protein
MLVEGVKYGGITYHDEDQPETDEDRQVAHAFLIAESQALHHHTSEALIRPFLGHADEPAFPWIELVAMRRPGQLPAKSRKLAASAWSAELT